MALGYMARAMQRGLDRHGEASLLDGVDIGKAVLERGVDLVPGIADRADDNFVGQVDVASIASAASPHVGQLLVHPDGSFKLTRKVEDNGFVQRFIVTAVA